MMQVLNARAAPGAAGAAVRRSVGTFMQERLPRIRSIGCVCLQDAALQVDFLKNISAFIYMALSGTFLQEGSCRASGRLAASASRNLRCGCRFDKYLR